MTNLSVVFASENAGKQGEVQAFANGFGIEVLTPSEAGLSPLSVEETGNTYEENALLKVRAYLSQAASRNFIICADDSGVEIAALGGEPGIHTRRWEDGITAMTDEAIIEYALARLEGKQDRSAVFRTAVAFSAYGGPIELRHGELRGTIATGRDPQAPPRPGYPFQEIFQVDSVPPVRLWKYYTMTEEERAGGYTHREQAFKKLFETLTKKGA